MRVSDLIERVVSESDLAGRGWVEVSPRVVDALAKEYGAPVGVLRPGARGVCVKMGLRFIHVHAVDGMPDDKIEIVCPSSITGAVELCRTAQSD